MEATQELLNQLEQQYQEFKSLNLKLDLTRGKPSAQQVALADSLDGLLGGQYKSPSGTDTRNYGGLDGLPEAKQLGAILMGVKPSQVLAGGNSSLTLMFNYVLFAHLFGVRGAESAWSKQESKTKFLCPVPGYDRHFTICETLGIEMINVPLNEGGPDMDQVEQLVKSDPGIKGMWCVPKYSNPTGHVYSDDTVRRIAALGKIASEHFRVMWDNAYAVHDLTEPAPKLLDILPVCEELGTADNLIITASTSKITFAGAGLSFMGTSEENLKFYSEFLGAQTIGPDKVNQLRHCQLLKDEAALRTHMAKHAEVVRPKFQIVLDSLEKELAGSGMGTWTKPQGGYFISFDTQPDLAKEVVKLAKEAGVTLTGAGATFPYKKDPNNCNIRIAPTFPPNDELKQAMDVFVCCVKLATVRKQRG